MKRVNKYRRDSIPKYVAALLWNGTHHTKSSNSKWQFIVPNADQVTLGTGRTAYSKEKQRAQLEKFSEGEKLDVFLKNLDNALNSATIAISPSKPGS